MISFSFFFFLQLYRSIGISPIENSSHCPQGKLAAIESPHPTNGPYWASKCFHNPPSSDMDYGIFNVHMWSLCMRITGLHFLVSPGRTFMGYRVCTDFWHRGNSPTVGAQSLARNGYPTMRWPRSIVWFIPWGGHAQSNNLYHGFRKRALSAMRHRLDPWVHVSTHYT